MSTIVDLKEHFEVTHTGFYRTRDGRKVFVNDIASYPSYTYALFGVIEGENVGSRWSENGKVWHGGKHPEDIVAEWES